MKKGSRQLRGTMPVSWTKSRPTSSKLLAIAISSSCLLVLHQLYRQSLAVLYASYLQDVRWYDWQVGSVPCSVSEKTTAHRLTLLSTTLRILNSVNLTAAVCLGTLWGVLRRQQVLPWDTNIDLCVLDSNYSSIDFPQLRFLFASENITMSKYDAWRGHFSFDSGNASGSLTVFYDCSSWYYWARGQMDNDLPDYLPPEAGQRPEWACPAGLRQWLLRDLPNVYQPLPLWLLSPPFRQLPLAGDGVPVPHDNYEMQKYMYPEDWWLEKDPVNC